MASKKELKKHLQYMIDLNKYQSDYLKWIKSELDKDDPSTQDDGTGSNPPGNPPPPPPPTGGK